MIINFLVGDFDLKGFNKELDNISTYFPSSHFNSKPIGKTMLKTEEGYYINANIIKIEFSDVIINNYKFIGKAYSTDKIIKIAESPLFEDFSLNNICDHCNSNRKRKFYYLFEKDDKIYQIGSSCVDDLLKISIKKYLDKIIELLENNIIIKLSSRKINCRFYSIEDIYFTAKNITNDWNTWKKKETANQIKNNIKKYFINNNSTIIEVRKSMNEIENHFAKNRNDFSQNIISTIEDSNGHFKRYYKEYEVGLVSYALYTINFNIKNEKGSWVGNIGETIYVEGFLHFKGVEDNPYAYHAAPIYSYELISDSGDYYRIKTSKEIDNLVNNSMLNIRASVSGKIGYQGKYKNIKYNSFKGRTKIDIK